MKKIVDEEISPGSDFKDDKVLWILHGMKVERFSSMWYLPNGTDVSSSVVDESLNVHGTKAFELWMLQFFQELRPVILTLCHNGWRESRGYYISGPESYRGAEVN